METGYERQGGVDVVPVGAAGGIDDGSACSCSVRCPPVAAMTARRR
ncbi:hypothetical protein ACQKM2_13845 [Streptomyces sp. NPDC004126]